MNKKNLCILIFIGAVLSVVSFFIFETRKGVLPVPDSLRQITSDVQRMQVLDRHGTPLTITYQNRWNTHDYVKLHDIPEFMQKIFVISEDKRFPMHNGVDWYARFHALWQNISSFSAIRGASTISEQVIRMIHPRPRTLWSRWLEGIEARNLEKKVAKEDIFEFYLNQVPYASNRRGVLQAAHYYFDRDLDTLSRKEMIALALLVRAPSHFDLYKSTEEINPLIRRLAEKLKKKEILSDEEFSQITNERFDLLRPQLPVHAGHFVRYIFNKSHTQLLQNRQRIHTTLDGNIQRTVQEIIDQCVRDLRDRRVYNGAALVVDHTSNEILAWGVAGHKDKEVPAGLIDAVTTPRQPGSSLKPFLYALSMENGWTAATIITDSPLAEPVGTGLHTYHNYNRSYYGRVTLRQALGNSLNIPAIRTIQFVGVDTYLSCLHDLGFKSLTQHPDFYGDGLALGNGEVTLFELVQAYTVIARHGKFLPITALQEQVLSRVPKKIFSEEVTSIIANILSDSEARYLEFGDGGLLNFPLQTAVKTGTSNDYRDAWAVGFNYHYTAGVCIGNLDGTQTDGVTGSIGPAMALRTIFSELNKFKETRPLYLSPRLIQQDICDKSLQSKERDCYARTEWFVRGTEPKGPVSESSKERIRFCQPTDALLLAMDPRIPDEYEAFEFYISGITGDESVEWTVDNKNIGKTHGGKYLWPLKKGDHVVKATVWRERIKLLETEEIRFVVK